MSSTDVLHRAKRRLDSLTPERLRVADDFLAYLEERESAEATEELLGLPGFRESLRVAEDEIARGELTPGEGQTAEVKELAGALGEDLSGRGDHPLDSSPHLP